MLEGEIGAVHVVLDGPRRVLNEYLFHIISSGVEWPVPFYQSFDG